MLDLSNNKLNGSIPDFLGHVFPPILLGRDLSYNNLSGPIPEVLLTRANSGELTLRTNGSGIHNAELRGKKLTITIIISVVASIFVLLLLATLIRKFLHRSPAGLKWHSMPNDDPKKNHVQNADPIVHLKTRRYAKTELESITQNFNEVLGKGGFGSVYAGTLPDERGTKVAVKKLSESSDQGIKEFSTEAEKLALLHHRNLVSLVGYCEDVSCLALVYEYMSQGSLEDHLRGKRSHERTLNWRERLRIASEAAEGLNYLHQECSERLVHRDVKSSNILLTGDLTAKVSDLGTARALSAKKSVTKSDYRGTFGYIDPQYGQYGLLTQKSDVYSFGVVLLKIITGQKAGLAGPEGVTLVERVRQTMSQRNSDIETIIDRQLRGDCGIDSVWSVYELARECTHDEPEPRPKMDFVATELKNALKMEDGRNINGVNRNSAVTGIAKQNLGTAVDTFDGGPALR